MRNSLCAWCQPAITSFSIESIRGVSIIPIKPGTAQSPGVTIDMRAGSNFNWAGTYKLSSVPSNIGKIILSFTDDINMIEHNNIAEIPVGFADYSTYAILGQVPYTTEEKVYIFYKDIFSNQKTRYPGFFSLTIQSALKVTAGKHINMKGAASITLSGASVSGGKAPYTYSWSPATDLSDPTILNPVCTAKSATVYTLTVKDSSSPLKQISESKILVEPDILTGITEDCNHFAENNPVTIECSGCYYKRSTVSFSAHSPSKLQYSWEVLFPNYSEIAEYNSGAYISLTTGRHPETSQVSYAVRLTYSKDNCVNSSIIKMGFLFPFEKAANSMTSDDRSLIITHPNPVNAWMHDPWEIITHPNPVNGWVNVSISTRSENPRAFPTDDKNGDWSVVTKDGGKNSFSTPTSDRNREWQISKNSSANEEVKLSEMATLVLFDKNQMVHYKGTTDVSPAVISLEGLAPDVYYLQVEYQGIKENAQDSGEIKKQRVGREDRRNFPL